MNAVTKDIADLLVANNIGAFGGVEDWAVYMGREPTKPKNVITLFDTNTIPPILTNSETVEEPTVQIRIRTINYVDGFTISSSITKIIDNTGQHNVVPVAPDTEYYYSLFARLSGPSYIGPSKEGGFIFVINYKCPRYAL